MSYIYICLYRLQQLLMLREHIHVYYTCICYKHFKFSMCKMCIKWAHIYRVSKKIPQKLIFNNSPNFWDFYVKFSGIVAKPYLHKSTKLHWNWSPPPKVIKNFLRLVWNMKWTHRILILYSTWHRKFYCWF